MSEPLRYHPDALARVLAIVAAAISDDVAKIVAVLLTVRGHDDNQLNLAAFSDAAGFGNDVETARDRLETADAAFFGSVFAVNLLDPRERRLARLLSTACAVDDAGSAAVDPDHVTLSKTLVSLLDGPSPETKGPDVTPGVDADIATWIAALRVAVNTGGGAHLGLRCGRSDAREVDDLAALLAGQGIRVCRIADAASDVHAAILRAELHAGERGAVVLIERDCLVEHPRDDEDTGFDEPKPEPTSGRLEPSHLFTGAMTWLGLVRNVYVWRIPPTGMLSERLDTLVGGCIGLIRPQRAWSDKMIAAMADGIGPHGIAALASRGCDPRDVGAMIATARCVAEGNGLALDAACAFVARSFSRTTATAVPVAPQMFDPRLLVSDDEARQLLERAEHVARNGGRVLAWGPPGGGKSAYAQALAARMGVGRPVVIVTPASILARPWGATERLLAGLWKRAADDGATLVIDELDSLCGVRESQGGSGGNAYLIRTLTDEWLRHFDGNPSVPVIATVNDVLAIDDAVRRRFAFVIEVHDELPPDLERLAWDSVLHAAPPQGWKPCGAAVADFTIAAARCRMLGLQDSASLATAIVRARDARRGPGQRSAVRGIRGASVH